MQKLTEQSLSESIEDEFETGLLELVGMV